ncbi:MAG: aldo/keto reductase [Thermaurantimonas sp.]|uniref:aldo/keto reductase n=1 Tax=Thermaurantimonas sp. TaxID=2681568 RepID=UPI00391D0611
MKYVTLGRSGLKVSEVCFGAMGLGQDWNWGADRQTSFELLETFANAGGNFIDTANLYTDGTSEKIIGEFIQADRDSFVIATKYTLADTRPGIKAVLDGQKGNLNGTGNNRKNLLRSLTESLKRLKTDYIDILYLHIWDHLTPIDEVMRAFDDVVSRGLVHYIAISDTPAWVVSRAQTIAELRGWAQFVALQVEYSLLQRTPERELIPMAQELGLTVTPWAPLAGGALTGKYLRGEKGRLPENSKRLSAQAEAITREVVSIANRYKVPPGAVALRWIMQQPFKSIPIVGATKVSQLNENLMVVDFTLEPEDVQHLNAISAIDLGFPGGFYREEGVRQSVYGGYFEKIEHPNLPK